MVISNKMKVKYSQAETKLLGILQKQKGPVDSATLHDLFYSDVPPESWHSRSIIIRSMRSLRLKADHNAEPFMIMKSEQSGQKPIEFWIEQRPIKDKKKMGIK